MRAVGIILAGGNSNKMRELTHKRAVAAMPIAGSYRAIDFALSNMSNSHIQKVAVLTQYNARSLNEHLNSSKWWDFGRKQGGLYVFTPTITAENGYWYRGTADAIYQNLDYMEQFDPDYVLILSGDHIYKMDYEVMLDYHKAKGAEVTLAAMPVPLEEAKRFGILITDEDRKISEFEEKPANPRSNLASMGIYIFNWKTLKEALIANASQPALDFGKHVIPYCHSNGAPCYAYEFNGYWKDVGTLNSYWEANMELIDIVPEFNLYEEYWKIYTKSDILPPQYISSDSEIEKCIIGEGSQIYGKIYNSVIGCGVTIGADTVVRDSIIMNETQIGKGCELNKAIVAENVEIGDYVKLGVGEEVDNETDPHIYNHGLVTIGEKSVIPSKVTVGKNSVVSGITTVEDYTDYYLGSGKTLIKAGDRS
mgnify:CR=1 FL=1